jgi:hypothetical protein
MQNVWETKEDPQKEEFRRYLEKNGVIDTLAKIFTQLNELEDKPQNPLEYIRKQFGHPQEYEKLNAENDDLKR